MFLHSAAGTLEIDNALYTRINVPDIKTATCFKEHLEVFITESSKQLNSRFLDERFTTGYLDKAAAKFPDTVYDFGNLHGDTLVKGIFGIAPGASEVAIGQPNENARPPSVAGFALDAMKNLIDK